MCLKNKITLYALTIITAILVSILFSVFFRKVSNYGSFVAVPILLVTMIISNKEQQAKSNNSPVLLRKIDYITICVAVAVSVFVAETVILFLDKLF